MLKQNKLPLFFTLATLLMATYAVADQQGWGVPSIISKSITFLEPATGQVTIDGTTTPSTLGSSTSGTLNVTQTTATANTTAQSINATSTADILSGGLSIATTSTAALTTNSESVGVYVAHTSSGTDNGGGSSAVRIGNITGGDANGLYTGVAGGTGLTRFLDSTTGHVRLRQTTVPSVSACGTGAAIVAGSGDTRGTVNVGSTNPTTSCTITFQAVFTGNPFCTLTQSGGSAGGFTLGYSVTTSDLTIVSSATMHNAGITWICIE